MFLADPDKQKLTIFLWSNGTYDHKYKKRKKYTSTSGDNLKHLAVSQTLRSLIVYICEQSNAFVFQSRKVLFHLQRNQFYEFHQFPKEFCDTSFDVGPFWFPFKLIKLSYVFCPGMIRVFFSFNFVLEESNKGPFLLETCQKKYNGLSWHVA